MSPESPIVTRFAPSPTGRLHLGHAYSALFAADACGPSGRFLLRIENIDVDRCRPEFEQGIFEDLSWLGLQWETPVWRQSEHMADYAAALHRLESEELLFPCFCTRKDLQRQAMESASAPHGPDGALYPGTCRGLREPAAKEPGDPARAASRFCGSTGRWTKALRCASCGGGDTSQPEDTRTRSGGGIASRSVAPGDVR